MNKKVIILVGLPLVGKTTYAKEYCKENNAKHICVDELIKHAEFNNCSKEDIIQSELKSSVNEFNCFVIDDLTVSNEHIISIYKNCYYVLGKNVDYEIIYFKPYHKSYISGLNLNLNYNKIFNKDFMASMKITVRENYINSSEPPQTVKVSGFC